MEIFIEIVGAGIGIFIMGYGIGSAITAYYCNKELNKKDTQIAELLGKNRELSMELEEMDKRFQKEYE